MASGLTLQEIERRFFDLLAATFLEFKPEHVWSYAGEEIRLPFFRASKPDEVLAFEKRVSLPALDRARWLLRIDISGNALLYVDGEPFQAVDEQHRLAVIPPGERSIVVEATPRRLFGENPWSFAFTGSSFAAVLWDEFHLALALIDLLQLAKQRKDLQDTLARAAGEIELSPSVLQVYAAHTVLYGHGAPESSPEYRGPRWDYAYLASVYGPAVLLGQAPDSPRPSVSEVVETAARVRERLTTGASSGRVYLFGHAHIDTAWLWPFSETKRKILRTFTTVARLAKMGYSFVFAQSGAQNYKWLEEAEPGLFEEIRELVREGKWLPIGGMWVESDTQLVSGESLARQFLYGQRYFAEKFGVKSRIGWLPDSFGFSAQLPQILRKAGVEVFVTHKVMWNDTNEFPYHAFVWEGLDGSEVLAHVIVLTYNGSLTASELAALWERYKQRGVAPAVHAYGFGDGGGGPTFLMLERSKRLQGVPGLPELVITFREEDYVSELLRVKDKLPRWKGEIYNEFHRGVYTTNLRVKELMSRAESEARWAELTATLAHLLGLASYPACELREAWERVLRCQFHDVLPGSANHEAYLEAYGDLEAAIRSFGAVTRNSLEKIAESVDAPAGSVIVFNPLPWAVKLPLELPGTGYCYPGGKPLEAQEREGKLVALVEAPPVGYVTLLPGGTAELAGGASARLEGRVAVLENELIRVVVGEDGKLLSVRDKETGFEYLAAPGNALRAHPDKPGNFDAWDIDRSAIEAPGHEFSPSTTPVIVARGPVFAAVENELCFRSSKVRVRISLHKGSRLVEIRARFDWREKCYLVKAWFDFNVSSEVAHFEVPFGVVERRTTPRDNWDEAKFEVPALRWMDLSDGEHGVAIIALTRHGYSVKGSRVGLSLLKSPLIPNPWSDLGQAEVVYYLYPHRGDYRSARVYERAYEVWAGLRFTEKRGDRGKLPQVMSFLRVEPGVVAESMKLSEDASGVVVRLYEVEGRAREAQLQLYRAFRVDETNLLEEPVSYVGEGSSLTLELKPFEVKTLLLRLSDRTESPPSSTQGKVKNPVTT